jgi:hypothetical protein
MVADFSAPFNWLRATFRPRVQPIPPPAAAPCSEAIEDAITLYH